MYRTALYNSCITICFFRAVFAWFDIKLCKESLRPVCQAVCGFVSFIKIGQKKTSVINSPLFYRLNYARITGHILYPNSAQVKDFLNILQRKCMYPKNLPFGPCCSCLWLHFLVQSQG